MHNQSRSPVKTSSRSNRSNHYYGGNESESEPDTPVETDTDTEPESDDNGGNTFDVAIG